MQNEKISNCDTFRDWKKKQQIFRILHSEFMWMKVIAFHSEKYESTPPSPSPSLSALYSTNNLSFSYLSLPRYNTI